MYSVDDVLPANRRDEELVNPHPVLDAYRTTPEGKTFKRDKVRETVIPSYMGLITQIDDELGRLFAFMDDEKLLQDTMIVFTSDHGDFLGDHWLGEKEVFLESAVHVPLIVVDPRRAANKTRGSVNDNLVESIDLLPTFLDVFGVEKPSHLLEGHSLLPQLHGKKITAWRDAVFSEMDYSARLPVRQKLRRRLDNCRGFMVRTDEWKYMVYEGFEPLLFNLKKDPQEQNNLASDPRYKKAREAMSARLFEFLRQRQIHPTAPEELVHYWADGIASDEVKIGYW